MNDVDRRLLSQVQSYRKLVLLYEGYGAKIDKLLMENDGQMENMSAEDLKTYRDLAQKRDNVFNEMLALGQELSVDVDMD